MTRTIKREVWLQGTIALVAASALAISLGVRFPHRHLSPVYVSAAYAEAAVQCRGMVRDGARCRNRTTDKSGLCYRHRPKPVKPDQP